GSPHWLKSKIQWDASLNARVNELKYDGFLIQSVRPNELLLTSLTERGLLYAVYSLLELAGCRWFYPGRDGEHIPNFTDLQFEELDLLENPDYEIRSFTDGSHKNPSNVWYIEMMETIDWCCKNKFNSVFIHDDPFRELDGIGVLKHEIKKRGMLFELGGHGIH